MPDTVCIQPKFLRLKHAPAYLGMDINRFSAEVRPYLTEIRIGKQGIAFDRLELDDWADEYKKRNGRPGRPIGDRVWDARKPLGSLKGVKTGTSIKESAVCELSSLLEQAASKKRKGT